MLAHQDPLKIFKTKRLNKGLMHKLTSRPTYGQDLDGTNFTKYRRKMLETLEVFSRTEVKRMERMKMCGQWLQFRECPDKHIRHLEDARFCKDRLCPMCNWRKSVGTHFDIFRIAHHMLHTEDSRGFCFLTLTVPNCALGELSGTLKRLNSGFTKMIRRNAKMKKIVKGYFRSIEITYNEKTNTWHPHIHAVLSVKRSYFSGRDYIKHSEWLDRWRRAYGDFNITQLNIKRMKYSNDDELCSAIGEVCKYTMKPAIYDIDDKEKRIQVLRSLKDQVKHFHLHQVGGEFWEYMKLLNIDPESMDTGVDRDIEHLKHCDVCGQELYKTWYSWASNQYKLKYAELVSESEKRWESIEESSYILSERLAIEHEAKSVN